MAILALFGMQLVWGVNWANAACEAEIREQCKNWHAVKHQKYGYDRCVKEKEYRTSSSEVAYKEFVKYLGGDKEDIAKQLQSEEKNLNGYKKNNVYGANNEGISDSEFLTCWYRLALGYADGSVSNSNSSNSNQQTTNNQPSSSDSSSSNEPSQQNSSAEEVERSSMKSNYAEKTAAYEQKYQGRGKKHNLDADANRCISVKGRKVLNNCDFPVEVVFCAINPDPNSKHAFEMANGFDCARNSKGMWGISARSPLMGVFTAERVTVFACKKPSLPGAEYDHQKQVLVGRCSEY